MWEGEVRLAPHRPDDAADRQGGPAPVTKIYLLFKVRENAQLMMYIFIVYLAAFFTSFIFIAAFPPILAGVTVAILWGVILFGSIALWLNS